MVHQGTFVDDVIAVVVDPVTRLWCIGIDARVVLSAVEFSIGACTGPKAVAITILTCPFPPIDTGAVTASAVIIDAVSTDLDSVTVNSGIGVVAIICLAAATISVAIFVAVTTVLAQAQNIPVAVLVYAIAGNVPGTRIDLRIGPRIGAWCLDRSPDWAYI